VPLARTVGPLALTFRRSGGRRRARSTRRRGPWRYQSPGTTATSRAYALDASSGRVLWIANLEAGATSPGICGSELFVGDFDVEVRSATTGAKVGVAFAGSGEELVTSLVTVIDGVAYAGTNKRLIALRCR